MVWVIAAGLVGVGIGYLLAKARMTSARVGTLRVDRSDPTESPYLFLELDPDGMRCIQSRRTVTLAVRTDNYLPRN